MMEYRMKRMAYPEVEDYLNLCAKEGWELSHAAPIGKGDCMVLCVRPKDEGDKKTVLMEESAEVTP